MAFWGGERLRERGAALQIVEGFDQKQIDCSAYTLRMGPEAYVTPSHGMDPRRNRKLYLKPSSEIKVHERFLHEFSETLVIPPGQFAFLLTEERIKMPRNAMGFISLKSGLKFNGLINVSGFHVDPGFNGRLIYSVFNAGPSNIHVSRGQKLFLLWIADLSGKIEDEFVKTELNSNEHIPSELVSKVARETYSFKEFSDRLDSVIIQLRVIWAVAAAFVAMLAIVLAYGQLMDGKEEPKDQHLPTPAGVNAKDQPPVASGTQADKRKE